MKPASLRLDFAPRAARSGWGSRALLFVGVACLAFGAFEATRLESERAVAENVVQTLDGRRTDDAARTPVKTRPDVRELALAREARRVAVDLTTPWESLLSSLGSVPALDVALLSIEPSAAKRAVRLTAEARDAHAMLAYLAALQHEPRLSSVMLVSHQIEQQAPGTPVRFQVQATWGEPS